MKFYCKPNWLYIVLSSLILIVLFYVFVNYLLLGDTTFAVIIRQIIIIFLLSAIIFKLFSNYVQLNDNKIKIVFGIWVNIAVADITEASVVNNKKRDKKVLRVSFNKRFNVIIKTKEHKFYLALNKPVEFINEISLLCNIGGRLYETSKNNDGKW